MPTLADFNDEQNQFVDRALLKFTGTFTVATTSPFTVYLDGGTDGVPAQMVAGLSYSIGTTGTYLLRQGQKPLCVPTIG